MRRKVTAVLLHIPEVLDATQLEDIRSRLQAASFADGRMSAGRLARAVKHNAEWDAPPAERAPLELMVAQAVQGHPLVQRHAMPLRIGHPIFSRYSVGQQYGWHTDDAVMGDGAYRADLAMTVFLSEPAEYAGGELVVQTAAGEQSARWPAGDAALYPADRLHRVSEVTKGERQAAVLWIQSQVRDEQRREVLSRLDGLRERRLQGGEPDDELRELDWVHSRLLRMWADV